MTSITERIINYININRDPLLAVTLAIIASALPAIGIEIYLENGSQFWFWLSIVFGIILVYSYTLVFKYYDYVTIFPIIKIIATILLVVIAVLFLKRKITGKMILGFLFAFVAIYLLS